MITLCVPTKDRAIFVERLLRYYATTRFSCWIFIGDSSEPTQAQQTRELVKAFSGQLKVMYQYYPDHSTCAVLEQLSHLVTTPYCTLVCDDDLLCTAGLQRCVNFLERHPEFSAAHGQGLMVQIEEGAPFGPIVHVRTYPQTVISAATGAERLREFLTVRLAVLLFSVHRIETWREMMRGVTGLKGMMNRNLFKDELVPSAISVVRGRVKELDDLYLVRQAHDAIYRHPHIFEWITSPEWFESYRFFEDRVTETLAHQDAISPERAKAVVKDVFWTYLANTIMNARQKEQSRPQAIPLRLREVAKQVPGLRTAWRGMRSRIQRRQVMQPSANGLSLATLLDPSCPWHADFMPLYTLIAAPSPSRAVEVGA